MSWSVASFLAVREGPTYISPDETGIREVDTSNFYTLFDDLRLLAIFKR